MTAGRGREHRPAVGDRAGFTLVELLVSIVILGVVVLPLGTSIVVGLKTTGEADQRMAEANDGRALTTALLPDVQSAARISTTDPGCGGAGTRLLLRQRVANSEDLENRAAYVVVTSGTSTVLVRRTCVGTTATVEQVLVRDLPSGASLSVTCTPRTPAGADVTIALQHRSGTTTTFTAGTRTSDGACA